MAFLEAHFLDAKSHCQHTNHVVIEIGESKVLVDVGSGNRFLPTTGRMLENLVASGINEDEITHVALTHAHPDHVWGIRDDFDEAIFPGAEYLIGATEFDWWMTDDRVNMVDATDQSMVLGAVNSLTAALPQLTQVSDWYGRIDMNPGATVETRKRLLDMVATDRMTIVSHHFPFPGVGHVFVDGAAYRFIPALWQWNQG